MYCSKEEAEEGAEPLALLEGGAEVAAAAAWLPLFSSTLENKVLCDLQCSPPLLP